MKTKKKTWIEQTTEEVETIWMKWERMIKMKNVAKYKFKTLLREVMGVTLWQKAVLQGKFM